MFVAASRIMAFPKPISATVLLSIALFASCAAPKAVVVEELKKPEVVEEPLAEEPPVPEPGLPDDGFRMPDLLTMPNDAEFRSTIPQPESSGTGAVIARPPTDPPPRPKGDNGD